MVPRIFLGANKTNSFIPFGLAFFLLAFSFLDYCRFGVNWLTYEKVSEDLVLNKVIVGSIVKEPNYAGLYLTQKHPNYFKLPDSVAITDIEGAIDIEQEKFKPYFSQFGLQGHIIGFLLSTEGLKTQSINDLRRQKSYWLIKVVNGFIFVLGLSLCLTLIFKEFGVLSYLFSLLFYSIGIWPKYIAHNLYWIPWTMLLPAFIVAFFVFMKKDLGAKFYLILFFSFLIRFLLGFEYLSNIVLMSLLPLLFKYNLQRDFKAFSVKSVYLMMAALLAFALGMLATVVQNGLEVNSFVSGFQYLSNRVSIHSLTANRGLGSYFSLLNNYFSLPLVSFTEPVPLLSSFYCFSIVLLLITIISIYNLVAFFKVPKTFLFFVWGAWLSSISWAIIAKGHMFPHIHLNVIIFYLPFSFVFFCFLLFSFLFLEI